MADDTLMPGETAEADGEADVEVDAGGLDAGGSECSESRAVFSCIPLVPVAFPTPIVGATSGFEMGCSSLNSSPRPSSSRFLAPSEAFMA